jgi:hypothetical protein
MKLRYHYIRTAVTLKWIVLHFVPSAEQFADIFTKQVKQPLFAKIRSLLSGSPG